MQGLFRAFYNLTILEKLTWVQKRGQGESKCIIVCWQWLVYVWTGILCPDLILIIMRWGLSHFKLSRLTSLQGIDFDQQQTIASHQILQKIILTTLSFALIFFLQSFFSCSFFLKLSEIKKQSDNCHFHNIKLVIWLIMIHMYII